MLRSHSSERRLSSTGVDLAQYTSEVEASLQRKILPAVLSYLGDCAIRRSLLSQAELGQLKGAMGEHFSKHLKEQLDKWETMIGEDLLGRSEVDEFNRERKRAAADRAHLMEGVEQLTQHWIEAKQQLLFDRELADLQRQLKSQLVKPDPVKQFSEISAKFEKLNAYLDDTERYLDRFEGLLDGKINAIQDR